MSRRRILRIVVPPVIVLAAVLVAVGLVKTAPTAVRTQPEERPTTVRVVRPTPGHERVRVVAMGTVVPAQEVVLQSEVSGRIVEQSPALIPGGHFRAGDVIARIDSRDYELAVEQQAASVTQARFELKVEEGRQTIAQHEWELLEHDVKWNKTGRELALRKPHMENATAALEAARSGLRRAELDLERTTLRAPFNAVVREEFIDVGQIVSPQTRIATIVGTDQFWVRASLPVDQLRWIRFPTTSDSAGSSARILHETGLGTTIERRGKVVRVLGDLDPKGRMARILVSIDDPLNLRAELQEQGAAGDAALPLLLGAYVRVEVEGTELEDVLVLPRQALRDGDRIWVMDETDRLAIRDVAVAWDQRDRIFVRSGVEAGERVVVSSIAGPVVGMRLHAHGEAAAEATARSEAVAEVQQ